MKPLLRSAPITKEDYECWRRHGWFGSDSWHLLCGMSRDSDRRDAEVMLQLVSFDHWERDYTEDRLRRAPTALRLVSRQL